MNLGLTAAVGAAVIVGLVVIGTCVIARRRHGPRSRPASPEVTEDQRRTLRSIAANDYHRQTKHEQE